MPDFEPTVRVVTTARITHVPGYGGMLHSLDQLPTTAGLGPKIPYNQCETSSGTRLWLL